MSDPRSDQSAPKPSSGPRQPGTANDTGSGAAPRDANKYRDRPSEDGKQGDAAQEPNQGFPHDDQSSMGTT
jgi:hypothetical protein